MLNKIGIELGKRLMQPINSSLVALLGAYTLVWGLWLLAPWWDVFTRAALYSKMDAYPEWAWGLFAVFSGAELLYGVIKNHNRDLRRGALVGFFHWIIVTGMYFAGDWHNTGGITALTISLYCFVIYLNYRKNKNYPQP